MFLQAGHGCGPVGAHSLSGEGWLAAGSGHVARHAASLPQVWSGVLGQSFPCCLQWLGWGQDKQGSELGIVVIVL